MTDKKIETIFLRNPSLTLHIALSHIDKYRLQQLQNPIAKAFSDAMYATEKLGASTEQTDAVRKIDDAKEITCDALLLSAARIDELEKQNAEIKSKASEIIKELIPLAQGLISDKIKEAITVVEQTLTNDNLKKIKP